MGCGPIWRGPKIFIYSLPNTVTLGEHCALMGKRVEKAKLDLMIISSIPAWECHRKPR